MQDLFYALYRAGTEADVDELMAKHQAFQNQGNWKPLGGDQNYYGVIENQQSRPIAALIEKITNSIDAILMKKCREFGIDPKSVEAPKSMQEAVERFFPDSKNWDLSKLRNKQAEDIQILAHGPRKNTSLVIYDNGEGQEPEKFEDTFLSLLKGNKKFVRFVQGVYNMGGTGAIVFCGKKRYQLVASRRVGGSGKIGFTIIRKHIKTKDDEGRKTWYEYFAPDGAIPWFNAGRLDLGLLNRPFDTGSIVKLYSYELPEGSRSVISTDLNQSINEFLFEPALPIYTIDSKERYADDNFPQRTLFGLKRSLEDHKKEYVERVLSIEPNNIEFGRLKITCYVFKPKVEGKDVKKTRESIRRLFFKNNMSVMFSVNGQVQAHYTSEFITRTLKFNLLRDYLLIHVDCTNILEEVREELFMASRDRLKEVDQEHALRQFLGQQLRKSDLEDINRHRKENIGLDAGDTSDLIRSLAKNLPKDSELLKLISNTLNLDEKKAEPPKKKDGPKKKAPSAVPFVGKRFPTVFELKAASGGDLPVIHLPSGTEKTVQFNTDVENDYFDRIEEPGELKIALLSIRHNDVTGGTEPGSRTQIEDVLNVVKTSPNNGRIKLSLSPTEQLTIGDEVEIKVSLSTSASDIERLLKVKVEHPEAEKETTVEKQDDDLDRIGLPKPIPVRQENWSALEDNGIPMNHSTVMYPDASGDLLEQIYINMDSNVLLRHKSRLISEDQILLAEKNYQASVYFHTLFLYLITKKRNYRLTKPSENGEEVPIDIATYLQDLFETYYTEFLINFKTDDLLQSLA
jgi:hypothetical protein